MITRRPLREEVRREVLNRLLQGNLAPGDRLKEISLARELGVSRTPLREALRELERVGLVSSIPGRGFSVARFSATEVRDVWPMMWTLEGLALRSAVPITPQRIENLEQINTQIAATLERPRECVELDALWHEQLIEGIPNRRLLATIASLTQVLRRYEYRFLDSRERISNGVRHHLAINRALISGEVDQAIRVLEEHRHLDMEMLLAALDRGKIRAA
jgi:DNA-binding GntR family transcriptional regulator